MSHQLLVKALRDIRPEAQWTLSGDDYSAIEWLDDEQKKPTIKEIEEAIANPLPEPELTVAEKLALVGLDLDDLKAALGI
jgi:hypothetical protein